MTDGYDMHVCGHRHITYGKHQREQEPITQLSSSVLESTRIRALLAIDMR